MGFRVLCHYYHRPKIPNPRHPSMAQSKRWCFTLNNYSEAELEACKVLDVAYCIFGEEKGESGTPHLQGYLLATKNLRLKAVSKLIPRAFFVAAKGTSEQNIAYCSKDNVVFEYGEKPVSKEAQGQAEKARWGAAKQAAISGNLDEVPDDIYVRYYRTLKEIKKDHMQKPADADSTTGEWLHGPPECGKSRKARQDNPGAYFKAYNKWWDGYQGEEVVILDDFENDIALGHHLKIWSDRYSFIGETKGGAIHIRPKKFIVTSNYSIQTIFGDKPELYAAVKRRFVETDMTPAPIVSPTSVSVAHFRKAKLN